VVLNAGGGGPDFRIEGYADLEGLYGIIRERVKDDA
jgi:hypothetical protein